MRTSMVARFVGITGAAAVRLRSALFGKLGISSRKELRAAMRGAESTLLGGY
jgi:hypothetical protein